MLTDTFATEWANGLTFDLSDNNWGGQGEIKVKTVKAKKIKANSIRPAITVLACESDLGGRSTIEHRARVDRMAERYDSGMELFANVKITDPDEQRGIAKVRSDEPWRDTRNSAYTDEDGLKLLASAFQAMHDENEDD